MLKNVTHFTKFGALVQNRLLGEVEPCMSSSLMTTSRNEKHCIAQCSEKFPCIPIHHHNNWTALTI